ncbi:MAG: hypothetical protein RIC52_13990 [Amphiplicatus sp.]
MANDLQTRIPPSSLGGSAAWRILGKFAGLLSFILVVAVSAVAVVLVAIAAPVAVSLSALPGLGGKRQRGRWRAALAA